MSTEGSENHKNIILSYVFNSPALVPWKVVEKHQDNLSEATEAILLFQECKRESNRFKEGDSVCEMNNPTLKMTIRRIIRQTVNEGTPGEKKRLIGMECYWWVSLDEYQLQAMQMNMRGRRVPGAVVPELEEEYHI